VSDAQYAAWLARDDANRTVLVRIEHRYEDAGAPVVGTVRWSDKEYYDSSADLAYVDCVRSIPTFSRGLSGTNLGSYQSSLGTIVADNADGDLDGTLDLACDGGVTEVLYGDGSWPSTDFRTVFKAITVKVQAPKEDQIDVVIKDTGVLLAKSVGGTTPVGGTGPNADRSRPFNFGFLHQVECLVQDETNLLYVHSDVGGGTTFAALVRDKGISINFDDNGDGTVSLLANPLGTITAEVMAVAGDSAPLDYSKRRVSHAFMEIVGLRCGLDALGLYDGAGPTFTELDDEDYFVGVSVPDSQNVITLLDSITDSGLCFWAITRLGAFTFGRLRPNDVASLGLTPVEMVEDDMDTYDVEHALPQYHRLQAYMNKNWSVQTSLVDSLSPNEQAYLTRKGLHLKQAASVGTTYAAAPELYDLTLVESPVLETILSGGSDGDLLIAGGDDAADSAVLSGWLDLKREILLPWLETLSVQVGVEFYGLELGDAVNVTMDKFGLETGELYQVVDIDVRLTEAKVGLKMIRRRAVAP